ncbi:MAG: winged helix-turn-helix domain-containing protein [Spirochaetes bacterium]|nr:winged helix-turn-helix domain-containing protein [Spirochaetota bacterium]
MVNITRKEAGNYLLKYQNLYNPRQLKSDKGIVDFIQKIGCIQYDPLNKVARNADLVLQSRCKNYSEAALYRLLYEKRELLDGWDKNMSIWSVRDWPYFTRKRNDHINRYKKRADEFISVRNEIIKKIKENRYISSKDVNGNRKVNWSWAPTDIGRAALESMYHCGELLIHHKEGTRKYYGLTEKLLPVSILNEPDPNKALDDFYEWYAKRRIGAIGLLWNKSGDAWLGSHLKKEERSQSIKKLLEKDEIVEVKIAGIDEIFYLPKKELKILENKEKHKEASVIAPLDNLIWDRKLVSKIFNFDYKWEVYTPVKERKYGYYVLPVIYNESFIGRCEPIIDRKNKGLIIQNWWWEKDININQDMRDALIRCFTDFARFLNVEKISISNTLSKDGLKWVEKCVS